MRAILSIVSLTPPRPSPLAPGYKLDRYELICPMAEGGMASVWIARHTGKHGFQRLVAIKTILPKYADQPRFERMFIDEARLASRIEHVNVAQTLDVGEQHGVTYLVMEYVDGDALSKVHRAVEARGESIPLGILLRVTSDACGGLHAAHELHDTEGLPLGVVHRDVSPQNILISNKGVAKLIDFGIAKARDRLAGDTNTDQLKGKVHYMAPEQALGRSTDRRADVWSVGAVLYHMLAGKPPYEGDNDVQSIFRLASGRPPVPLPPAVHPAVVAVVRRALLHDPEKRYATAAELQQALEMAMIEAEVSTSHAAVAAFLERVVADRAKRRRDGIALGLKAAEERDKYAAAMRSDADTTGETAPSLGNVEPSSASLATLGSSAITVAPRDRPRRRTIAVVSAVLGGVLGIAGIVMILASKPANPPSAAGPPPQPGAIPSGVSYATATTTAGPSTAPATPSAATSGVAPSPSASSVSTSRQAGQGRPVLSGVVRPVATAKTRVNDGF
jgi:eukaryotic-like serine/threonine-protein kinase